MTKEEKKILIETLQKIPVKHRKTLVELIKSRPELVKKLVSILKRKQNLDQVDDFDKLLRDEIDLITASETR